MSIKEEEKNFKSAQKVLAPLNLKFIKENESFEEHSKNSNNNISAADQQLQLSMSSSKGSKKLNKLKTPSRRSSNSKHDKNTESLNFGINTGNSNTLTVNKRYSSEQRKDLKQIDQVKREFESTGKFMQINPHFLIFHRQLHSLRDSIYDDTKRCLILKGSLQQSNNILKNESDGLIKDIVSKIYDLRELFEKGNIGLNQTAKEVQDGLDRLKETQAKARKEIIECDKRIDACENQIGYKLLGNPNYSFIKDKNKNLTTEK